MGIRRIFRGRRSRSPRTPGELALVVARRDEVAEGVVAFELRAADSAPLPSWEPGAHIELLLDVDGTPLLRQYSLCGSPADTDRWRIAVVRDAAGDADRGSRGTGGKLRSGSAFLHDAVMAGDVVRARGPRNAFPFAVTGRHLFIAGGIGITPLLPMIVAADAAGSEWRLLYGGRTRASMAFLDELAGHGDRVRIRPQDEYGVLDLGGALAEAGEGTDVHCCGPEPMLAAAEACYTERADEGRLGALHVERFGSAGSAGPAEGFEVELRRSGRVLRVPADMSVLDVLEEAGIPAVPSCRQGTCGSCETTVLEGVPDHRDSTLSPSERAAGDVMLICVSRSRDERLVLDL